MWGFHGQRSKNSQKLRPKQSLRGTVEPHFTDTHFNNMDT